MQGKLQRTVGKNIRKFRKQLGLSQEELAEMCSLHRTYIGGVERGERNVTLETLAAIAHSLNKSPVELMEEDDES